jgi:hypothetical protein
MVRSKKKLDDQFPHYSTKMTKISNRVELLQMKSRKCQTKTAKPQERPWKIFLQTNSKHTLININHVQILVGIGDK